MKKLVLLILVFSLISSCASVLTSCGQIQLKIDFVVDGEIYASVNTAGGESIAIPENPIKEGYTFEGWYWDKDTWEMPFTANSLLNTPLSSDMSVYARWEHIHTISEWIIDSEPSCKTEGIRHKQCTECEKILEKGTLDILTTHTPVTDARVDPTLTSTGLTEGSHCSVCDLVLLKQEIIPVLSQNSNLTSNVLTINDMEISGKVSHNISTFNFSKDISVSNNATWVLSTDIYGENIIAFKSVSLSAGNNTFFIHVMNPDKTVDAYVVNIYRNHLYTVEFNSNGGTGVEVQYVEEGNFANEPTTTRPGHTFLSWDYDFKMPINSNLVINANWTPNYDVESAAAFLKEMYIEHTTETRITNEIELVSSVKLLDVLYDVIWTTDNDKIQIIYDRSSGKSIVKPNLQSGETVPFEVIGTITNPHDKTDSQFVTLKFCAYLCYHKDRNDDEKCDECGTDWKDTKLLFQMTNNDDSDTNPSGCQRYLAGDYEGTDADDIDDMIAKRNAEAYMNTKVDVEYAYYGDTDAYGMGNVGTVIYNNIFSGSTKANPDMYCNFNAVMISLSLRGCWANVKSESKGENYLQFNNPDYDEDNDDLGYMYDYMENCTLSMKKMYILASDYFTDLIRSFYVVPVNVKLLESVGNSITGDRDGDGKFTLDDFYDEVRNKDWNYNLVAMYSAAIYQSSGTDTTGGESIHDRLGWAINAEGLQASGILYTTPITIINKIPNADGPDYEYSYPKDSPNLYMLCDNLKVLMGKTGVMAIKKGGYEPYGDSGDIAIRNRFCDDKILFGGITLLGSLELPIYQTMKGSSGFGIVPVPFYYELTEDQKADDLNHRYLTAIHNSGRSGAIAVTTPNFSQCTAFIDYQSTHSTDILDEYYDYKLQYTVVNGSNSRGTVEMLQYIRNNVRSNLDKTMEDLIQGYNNAYDDEWHVIMFKADYSLDIRGKYSALYETKMDRLDVVLGKYPSLPDPDV